MIATAPTPHVGDPRPGGELALKRAVHQRLLSLAGGGAPPSVAEVRSQLGALLHDADPLLARERHARLVEELADEVAGLGPLEPLLADPTVTEIMLNGPGRAFVERAGRLEPVDLGLDSDAIVRIVERVVTPLGLRLDRASPMVDARLPDGSRLHAIVPPLALDGPCVTVRRFTAHSVPLEAFSVGPAAADFLGWAVRGGWNLLVAGGTSAGKTTLLNSLSGSIDPVERVVTVEETAELRLAQPHVVRLEARPANGEGAGEVRIRDLVRAALRMRPDRIVVGEVRGPEALDLLQALNTGHDGALSTVHANGAVESLHRLETLALLAGAGLPVSALRAQIALALDAVIYVARRPGGRRCIEAIAEVVAGDQPGVRTLFALGPRGLRAVAEPGRRSRRPDAPASHDGWFTC